MDVRESQVLEPRATFRFASRGEVGVPHCGQDDDAHIRALVSENRQRPPARDHLVVGMWGDAKHALPEFAGFAEWRKRWVQNRLDNGRFRIWP